MEKINELVNKCKGGVFINFNLHRDNSESVEEYIQENAEINILPEVLNEMIAKNIVVNINFFPEDPFESEQIYHYDLEKAVDEALTRLGD